MRREPDCRHRFVTAIDSSPEEGTCDECSCPMVLSSGEWVEDSATIQEIGWEPIESSDEEDE